MTPSQPVPSTYHKSVLVSEVLHYWHHKPGGLYLDVTFGGGGHTRALLERDPQCQVIAIDWDKNALDLNMPALQEKFGDRIIPVWGNFAQLEMLLKRIDVREVDGILADFGTSQYQITYAAGFSFSSDSPLDMRMSPSHTRLSAAQVLAHANERVLADIFFEYSQERYARAIARAIVTQRGRTPFKTTRDLARLVESIVPRTPHMHIHPATRVFQALRIYVNSELENINAFLASAFGLVADQGRIVCISFHSLEDRIVKQFFVDHACAKKFINPIEHADQAIRPAQTCFEILTKRPIMASEDEVQTNASARSARLRAACVHVGSERSV